MRFFSDDFLPERYRKIEQFPMFMYLLKWTVICALVGILAGTGSAWFLMGLQWATEFRTGNMWIVWLLPIGGLMIGLLYHYLGESVVKGNNQLLEEIVEPKKVIPLRMAPLVVLTTIATHLFGGSAGREGTAVQMGGSIADQFTKFLKLDKHDRKILLIAGIAAGFSSVFGAPLAGAVFGLEVYVIGRMRYEALYPSFLAAIVANQVCHAWHVPHTAYTHPVNLEMTSGHLLYAIIAGVLFGLTGMLFSKANHFWSDLFKRKMTYAPLRPFVGGAILALVIWGLSFTVIEQEKFIGLGVPVIVEAFGVQMPWYSFLMKLLFTSFTLGCGFKGGEVTPLFFIGATLGSALSGLIPLPLALLAAMGFVGVFAGATNTPIACTLMGVELFGVECGVYLAIACVCAYLFSGHSSIYSAQVVGSAKHRSNGKDEEKSLASLKNDD